jgi:hypothetical protein
LLRTRSPAPRAAPVSIRERVAGVPVKKVPRRLHQHPQEAPVAELIELPRRRDRDTRKKCARILEFAMHKLNTLASNISLGRDASGVHWRSDGTESLRLRGSRGYRAVAGCETHA